MFDIDKRNVRSTQSGADEHSRVTRAGAPAAEPREPGRPTWTEHRRAAAADARESTRASRRAESNAISASDDEKLEMLEETLIALKTRVAALACLNEDAARETNAGSE